jgi:ABC-2 type transport system ATP-binding protein
VTLRLVVQGDVDRLIKLAAQYPLVNIVSQEPSLEDIFLRYYREDNAPARTGDRDVVA